MKPTNKKTPNPPARLIETDTFPFEFISSIAERESWRKEIYRPVYHIHKWWAKRLGSVFRGILLGCHLPEGTDFRNEFYRKHDLSKLTVFDPFIGSGTTIGEAHKLGCAAVGRDINPVACESVRVALGPLDRRKLEEAFHDLSDTVGTRIKDLYKSTDKSGQTCDVLYYFWVKAVSCPQCGHSVDLFPSRVFARNAYPGRKPDVQLCCPRCGDIFRASGRNLEARCPSCETVFNPNAGSANGTKANCSQCSHEFTIIDAVRRSNRPPAHRFFAKLILTATGRKTYLPATADDEQLYQNCVSQLKKEITTEGVIRLPDTALADGFNTRQAISYNYLTWRDFFNDRQLLALGWLQHAIMGLTDIPTRDAFLTLFSGLLEFNNMFASYKGEGTGAVRHMFAHHILKPERMPIEANVWGTPKSSGSFLNLFKGRLLRAIEYRETPFEVSLDGAGKKYRCADPFSGKVETTLPPRDEFKPRSIYLSCGSSDATGLPDKCVDLVVTDPPFFDNVHYSELADFFYAWQSLYPRGFLNGDPSTRHPREVQDADPEKFATKLQAVFKECHRVLKDKGLLVFTYHHSRPEGWTSLASALFGAGFSAVNAHPVKAEMSVAAPKSQAKDPIQLDIIFVCKKRGQDSRARLKPLDALKRAAEHATAKIARLGSIGLRCSKNDCRSIVMSQFLVGLGPVSSPNTVVNAIRELQDDLEVVADEAAQKATSLPHPVDAATPSHARQMHLPLG